MTTTDPLAVELNKHIWFTTTNRGGKKPFVICKCTAQMTDSDQHAVHVAKVARKFLAAA